MGIERSIAALYTASPGCTTLAREDKQETADSILFRLAHPRIVYVVASKSDTRSECMRSNKVKGNQKPERSVDIGFAEIKYYANKVIW